MNKKYEIMRLRHSIKIAKKMIANSDKRRKSLVNDLKLGIKEMKREIKKLEKQYVVDLLRAAVTKATGGAE